MKRKRTQQRQLDTKQQVRIRKRIRLQLSSEPQLMDAVSNQNLRHVAQLIANGADVNTRDACHDTPLALAAWSGQVEVLQLLLRAGASTSINHRDRDEGIIPLHAAVIVCREWESTAPDNVFHLIAAGADPNIPDRDGWTPLHSCAFYRLPQLIPALLAAGADPTRRDRRGRSPADIAQAKGFSDIESLLSAPSDIP